MLYDLLSMQTSIEMRSPMWIASASHCVLPRQISGFVISPVIHWLHTPRSTQEITAKRNELRASRMRIGRGGRWEQGERRGCSCGKDAARLSADRLWKKMQGALVRGGGKVGRGGRLGGEAQGEEGRGEARQRRGGEALERTEMKGRQPANAKCNI